MGAGHNGAVIERYEYGDYGKVAMFDANGNTRTVSSHNVLHLYTGRSLITGTDLYDYRFRVLDPQTGRFVQRDPLWYVDGMGLYGYVSNNPFKFGDPLGLRQRQWWLRGMSAYKVFDPHDPEGIFFTVTLEITNCEGKKLYFTYSGTSKNTRKFAKDLGELAQGSIKIYYLEVSAHHSNQGIWGLDSETKCQDSDFANNINLADNATVDLHMCNSTNLADLIAENNDDNAIGFKITTTKGTDMYRDDNKTDCTPSGRRVTYTDTRTSRPNEDDPDCGCD